MMDTPCILVSRPLHYHLQCRLLMLRAGTMPPPISNNKANGNGIGTMYLKCSGKLFSFNIGGTFALLVL